MENELRGGIEFLPPDMLQAAADLSWMVVYVDTVRLAHLIAIILGLGSVIQLALSAPRILSEGISRSVLDLIDRAHGRIVLALAVLWVSGLALVQIRTGFDPSATSPKLVTKLVVVTVLTVDAVLMAWLVKPAIAEARGSALQDLSWAKTAVIANCVALSGASWTYALVLGASSVLKTAEPPVLIAAGLIIYGSAYAAVFTAAALLKRPAGGRLQHPNPA